MSQTVHAPEDHPLGAKARLFDPGERLGWIYRDPGQFFRPFPEPAPVEQPPPPAPSAATPPIWIPIVLGVLVLCLGGCLASAVSGNDPTSAAGLFVVAALAGLGAAVGGPLLMVNASKGRLHEHQRRVAANRQAYLEAVRQWQLRGAEYHRLETIRINRLADWGAATTGTDARRVDIYGGNLWSWEAFLTVFCTSMLGSRRKTTVVDLSGEAVSSELIGLAAAAGYGVEANVLPDQLAECDLLSGLDTQQLIDVLIESMHGEEASNTMTERAKDTRILTKLCEVLQPTITLSRLAEAVRALMGEPAVGDELSRAERDRIVGELFHAEYVQNAYPNLSRIEAHIQPLEGLGHRSGMPAISALRAIVLRADGPSARTQLLADLLVQWVMRVIVREGTAAQGSVVVVVGADAMQRRHTERLADIAERRNVRLVYLFRHVRESSLHLLGGGVVGLMKLGNHEEAERAASFIGRDHSFQLSQLTSTTGGSSTHTETLTHGESEMLTPFGTPQMLPNRTRTWGESLSSATASTWSMTTTKQRVYEYRVEPTVVQSLPDFAMLLVQSVASGPVIDAVDCNPDLVSLPRLLNIPLPSAQEVRANPDGHAVIPAPAIDSTWRDDAMVDSASPVVERRT
jgi:hypothetical protein